MTSDTVTGWIGQLADGDDEAAQRLWEHLGPRLHDYAKSQLDVRTRRSFDEHDIANSAFNSLCRGIADGRLEVANRGVLWSLLAVIAARKVTAKQRYLSRQKRGGGGVNGDSEVAFTGQGGSGVNELACSSDPPDVLAEVAESCDQLLAALPDDTLREIVVLKFQGATDLEVADALNCTRRTIARKLEKIRRIWIEFKNDQQLL